MLVTGMPRNSARTSGVVKLPGTMAICVSLGPVSSQLAHRRTGVMTPSLMAVRIAAARTCSPVWGCGVSVMVLLRGTGGAAHLVGWAARGGWGQEVAGLVVARLRAGRGLGSAPGSALVTFGARVRAGRGLGS